MINPIRKLINNAYEYISPDRLFIIKDNKLSSRDDIVNINKQRRIYVSDVRVHLTAMATLIDEIDFCEQQLKRILEKEQSR